MNEQRDEKPLFSEIFYRKDKKFIFKKIHETYITTLLMLIGGFLVLGFLLGHITDLLNFIGVSIILGSIGWIIFVIYSHIYTMNTALSWMEITLEGVRIIKGIKDVNFPIRDIKKIAINLKKKRIEVYLTGGRVIYLKRDKNRIEYKFLSYDQFERFKKAMKEIGVEYEVIYA